MGTKENGSRIIAACTECGSMYAALRLSSGAIQPIGSRRGCTTCGETEFTPLTQFSNDTKAGDSDDG